jgi:ribosomal protein S15P/S13E
LRVRSILTRLRWRNIEMMAQHLEKDKKDAWRVRALRRVGTLDS